MAANAYLFTMLCFEGVIIVTNIFWFVNWLYHLLSKKITIEPSHKVLFYASHVIAILSFILSPTVIFALILEYMILNIPQEEHRWIYTSHNTISGAFYGLGKVTTYIILLLRIKTLLQNSIFDLNRNTYYKVIVLLCINFVSYSSSFIILWLFWGSIYLDVFCFMWYLSDTVISVVLTKLYLSKLTQIYQTIVMKRTKMNNYNYNNNNNNNNSDNSTAIKIGSNSKKKDRQLKIPTSKSPTQTGTNSASASDDENVGANRSYISSDSGHKHAVVDCGRHGDRNDQRAKTLFEMIVRFGVLEVVIIVSSFAVFVSMASLNLGSRDDISFETYYAPHLDCTINIMSICFMFNYATPFYQCLCKPCHWITRKCVARIAG